MLEPIIAAFLNVMLWIYSLFSTLLASLGTGGAFGLTIIAFTIIVRLATYPFNASQMKSTKAMQDLQSSKEWQKIQKKYKNDREKLSQEQMKLYQEMGVNPLGSCLPTLIQLPIIFALYWAVTRALASTPLELLDLAGTIGASASRLIPLDSTFLWMDLGQPERLILPFLPSFGIPVLAIVVTVTSYLQTKMMTPTTQPGQQGAAMGQAMSLYMPLFMGYISYIYASGLALYFVTSNIASMVQFAIMGRLNWRNLLPGAKKEEAKT